MTIFVRRFSYFLLTTFLSLSLIFFFIRFAPGDPVEKILGPNADAQEILKYEHQLGLHKSLIDQYQDYLLGIIKGDLGESLFSRKKVTDLLLQHLPPTMILAFGGLSLSLFFGLFIGVLSAIKNSQMVDHLSRILSIIIIAFPIFSLGPVLVLVFAIKLKLLPVSEWGNFSHSILPILTLALPLGAILCKVTRNKFLEEKAVPWVEFLKAKGMPPLGINLRILKICLPTILNIAGIQLSVVLAGTMITETIFDIPGMGMLLFESIANRDYPVVSAIIIYSTVIYMGIYFFIDALNEKLDPRMTS